MAVTPTPDRDIGIVPDPCGEVAEGRNWQAALRNVRTINSNITDLDAGDGTTTTITIVSDVRYDSADTLCVQKKTRSIKVFSAGAESDWTEAGCP